MSHEDGRQLIRTEEGRKRKVRESARHDEELTHELEKEDDRLRAEPEAVRKATEERRLSSKGENVEVDAAMLPVPESPLTTPNRPRNRVPGTPVEPD